MYKWFLCSGTEIEAWSLFINQIQYEKNHSIPFETINSTMRSFCIRFNTYDMPDDKNDNLIIKI